MRTSHFILSGIVCFCIGISAWGQAYIPNKVEQTFEPYLNTFNFYYLQPESARKLGVAEVQVTLMDSTAGQAWLNNRQQKPRKGKSISWKVKYGQRGRLEGYEFYGPEKKLTFFDWKYDTEGRLIERSTYYPGAKPEGMLDFRFDYYYARRNRPDTLVWHSSRFPGDTLRLTGKYLVWHDKENRPLKVSRYMAEYLAQDPNMEKPGSQTQYLYDKSGRLLSSFLLNANGDTTTRKDLIYDLDGRLSRINYIPDPTEVFEVEYDAFTYENGRLVQFRRTYIADYERVPSFRYLFYREDGLLDYVELWDGKSLVEVHAYELIRSGE